MRHYVVVIESAGREWPYVSLVGASSDTEAVRLASYGVLGEGVDVVDARVVAVDEMPDAFPHLAAIA